VNPLPSQAGWQIVPLAVALTTRLLPPWSWAQNFAVAEAGILSPHHKTNTYFTGILIKIEQLAGLCNWTLVPRNSSDSNWDSTKCYRIDANASSGPVLGRQGRRTWDGGRIGVGWYTWATCTPTS
jgi:hypothetical protein